MADARPNARQAAADAADETHPRKLNLRLIQGWVGEVELTEDEQAFLKERQESLDDAFYSEAFYTLVRRWVSPPQARHLWGALREHRETLNGRVGRDVGVQVACLDFLAHFEETPWSFGIVESDALEFLLHDSVRDGLTQLFDREAFLATLDREIDRARRYHRNLALDLLDLDDFGEINASRGRIFGDYVLREVAAILERTLRSSDMACRYRGEQFTMVLPESNVQRAFLTAERVRRIVEKSPFVMREGQEPLTLTVSAGVAEYPIHGRDAATLLESAESALHLAKEQGKNRVCLPPRVMLGT